jgi:hypothetical protein
MANHFLATIYGWAQTYDGKNGGWQTVDYSGPSYQSFPSAGTVFIGLSPTQVVGGVTCAALISVLPTGLIAPGTRPNLFATDSTLGTLNTNAA